MTWSPSETIAAIASAPGPAERGILRISGPGVIAVLERLGLKSDSWSRTRSRSYPIEIPVAGGELLFAGNLLLWPTARSFTGEPLAELHLPGSPPLLNEVLTALYHHGARPAQPGEFTLRAFLAGRIDLVQAEAVLGVIDAGSSAALSTALGQLAGGISGRIADLREQLLLHLADLEAGLDFVEEDIEFVQRPELTRRLREGETVLQRLLQQSQQRMQSTGRFKVVLAGLPNAGKSTLFNRLAGTNAALVSPIAGTTRDYLSATLQQDGVVWELLDTAGCEVPRDGIEAAAAGLRIDQLQRAHLIIWCTPGVMDAREAEANARFLAECRDSGTPVLEIQTKSDLGSIGEIEQRLAVSAEQLSGLVPLQQEIVRRLSTEASGSEMISSTAARCAESLHHALLSVQRACELTGERAGDELIALELREVLEHLGRIVGQVYTDDILDRIFSRFCIGK
ncbi:tRNA modification GTPase [Planctomicrobium sp. SH664]|uniref:tRNA modification GTPase n=1 Tax=Planctomicrobium sp. SH664 TaxID=3448125 RepID=UPI003F5B069C